MMDLSRERMLIALGSLCYEIEKSLVGSMPILGPALWLVEPWQCSPLHQTASTIGVSSDDNLPFGLTSV